MPSSKSSPTPGDCQGGTPGEEGQLATPALRKRAIVFASWLGIGVNLCLAILKIGTGVYAESLAVIADGIDTTTDVLTSLITLLAAYIMNRPANANYPFGYARIETLATKVIAFVVFFVGLEIALAAGQRLLTTVPLPSPDPVVLWVAGLSVVAKGLLARYLFIVGRRQQSSMVRANAINMKNDLVLSSGVLVGLAATLGLGVPALDAVLALLIGLWIVKSAFEIFLSTSAEVMDGGDPLDLYRAIVHGAEAVEGVYNPHRIRVRRLSYLYAIELDVEVDGELTVREGHRLCQEVEGQIRNRIDNVYDIVIHLEPLGNVERGEPFGVCGQTFHGDDEQRPQSGRGGAH
ncbi:MAG: cation diffusion facilitator family transporter [Candidatus Competibacterales bacterium]